MGNTRRVPKASVEQLIAAAVEVQDRARQVKSYTVIGRLYTLETESGRIQFDKLSGPGIAHELDANGEPTGQMLFVTGWDKLPAVKDYSEEFCADCLATCDVCDGEGKSLCIFMGCGGRGRVSDGEDPCPGEGCTAQSGKFNPSCTVCGGYGAIAKFKDCPSCAGTGKAACAPCRGTGKRPSGRNSKGDAMCSSCNGSQRAGKFRQQELGKVITGRLGNNLVIGPVAKMILTPVLSADSDRFETRWSPGEAKGGASFVRIVPEKDVTGQPMLVLLPLQQSGKTVMPYFFGGSVL